MLMVMGSHLKFAVTTLLNSSKLSYGVNLCPVSSVINIENQNKTLVNGLFSGNFIYPLEIYAKNELKYLEQNNLTIRCFAPNTQEAMHKFTCPLTHNIPCPVVRENIQDSLNISQISSSNSRKTAFSSLCEIKMKLSNKDEKIRVLVFGGSVTMGIWSEGCCTETETNIGDHAIKRCAWPHFFGEWSKQAFPASVETISIAYGGVNSNLQTETFIDRLKKEKVTKKENVLGIE